MRGGDLVDRVGLVRAVRVELELTGVGAVVVDPGAGRDHLVGAEVRAERLDHLVGRRRDDHHVAARAVVLVEELERLGEHDRRDHLVERLAHDRATWSCCQPLVSESIASRTSSIFASSAPTSM